MNYIEQNLTISGGTLPCIQFGTGKKTFVMISGMSMAGIAGLGAAVSEAYKRFTEEYTIYLFDCRNELPDGWTICDMAKDVAEGMRLLGLHDADVMGASMGGMVAQMLAIIAPELVHSLVLASSDCYQSEFAKKSFLHWAALADRKDGQAIYRDFFHKVFCSFDPAALAAVENTGTDAQCRRFGIEARACLAFDSREELKNIRCPVFVYGSAQDNVLGGDSSETLAKHLGCQAHIFSQFGHAVYDETPEAKEITLRFFAA